MKIINKIREHYKLIIKEGNLVLPTANAELRYKGYPPDQNKQMHQELNYDNTYIPIYMYWIMYIYFSFTYSYYLCTYIFYLHIHIICVHIFHINIYYYIHNYITMKEQHV